MVGDDLDRAAMAHVEAVIAAQHHPVRPGEADQEGERVRRMAHRVVVEPAEIAERAAAVVGEFGPHPAPVVEPAGDMGEYAAGMGQADREAREPVERPGEDQMRRRDARLGRVADQVGQVVAGEPLRRDDVDRVQEQRQAQRLHPLVDRVERRVAGLAVEDVGRRVDAADAGECRRAVELGGGQVRLMPGQRRQPDQPVRVGGMRVRAAVVERRGARAGARPVREIDHRHGERQRLDRHPGLVHVGDPEVEVDETAGQRADGGPPGGDAEPVPGKRAGRAEPPALGRDQAEIALRVIMGVDVYRRMGGHRGGTMAPFPAGLQERRERRPRNRRAVMRCCGGVGGGAGSPG